MHVSDKPEVIAAQFEFTSDSLNIACGQIIWNLSCSNPFSTDSETKHFARLLNSTSTICQVGDSFLGFLAKWGVERQRKALELQDTQTAL